MKSILDRIRVYMEAVLCIKIAVGEWHRFDINAEVRHKIVHNNSNIITDYSRTLEEQPKYTAFMQNPAFNVSETGFIFVRELRYLQESHNAAIAFVNQTFETVKVEMRKRGFSTTITY